VTAAGPWGAPAGPDILTVPGPGVADGHRVVR